VGSHRRESKIYIETWGKRVSFSADFEMEGVSRRDRIYARACFRGYIWMRWEYGSRGCGGGGEGEG